MTPEQISERLKEIGPYVSYSCIDTDQGSIHTWHVKDVESGRPKHHAMLGLKNFDGIDWPQVIKEGRERYARLA